MNSPYLLTAVPENGGAGFWINALLMIVLQRKRNQSSLSLKKRRCSLPGILLTLPAHEGTRVDHRSYNEDKCTTLRCPREKKLLQFPPDLTHEYVATTHALISTKPEGRISYFLLGWKRIERKNLFLSILTWQSSLDFLYGVYFMKRNVHLWEFNIRMKT